MTTKFSGDYSDLLAIAAEELREGFSSVEGMEDADALLRKVAADAVARFERPIDIFNAFPQTLGHDFGSLTFDHGDTVGDAIRRLAESMIREETHYAMYDCLWDSFQENACASALACIETAEQLFNRGVGLSQHDWRMADECYRTLHEDGRIAQPMWAVLQGALNGVNELLVGRLGNAGMAVISELGGVEKLQAVRRDLSKLTYLLAEDREDFAEKMAEIWKDEVRVDDEEESGFSPA